MKKPLLIAGAALIAVAGAAWAQPGAAPRPDRNADLTRQQAVERVDQRFARLDLDRDGRFTREEAQQVRAQRRERRGDRMFARLDLDSNGSVTREEMRQSRDQRAERRAERRAAAAENGDRPQRHRGGRMHGRRHGMAFAGNARLFRAQGFVTAEQMRERALARFDRMDADRNGTLTAAERREARAQMRERFRERRQAAPRDAE